MGVIGYVDASAKINVSNGEEASIVDLFSPEMLFKEFTVGVDEVYFDSTKMRVHVDKFGSFETTPAVNRFKKVGALTGKVNLASLLKSEDLERKLKASKDVGEGEKLRVSCETL
jgi:hypothetical protein